MNIRTLILFIAFFIAACETPKPKDLTRDIYVIEHSNDSILLNNSINEVWKSKEFTEEHFVQLRMVRYKMDFGKYNDALQIIERIISSPIKQEDRLLFLTMKMETYYLMKEYEKSNNMAKTILKMDSLPDHLHFSILLNLGNNFFATNDLVSQRFYTKQALEFAETNHDERNIRAAADNLFLSYLRNDEFEQANYYNTIYDLGFQRVIDAKVKGDTNYLNIVRLIRTVQ